MDNRQTLKSLQDIAIEVQRLIDIEFANCNNNPPTGSVLDQIGLKDGKEIVLDYLNHREIGLALEHLMYMIKETDLPISAEIAQKLKSTALEMNMEISIKFLDNDDGELG